MSINYQLKANRKGVKYDNDIAWTIFNIFTWIFISKQLLHFFDPCKYSHGVIFNTLFIYESDNEYIQWTSQYRLKRAAHQLHICAIFGSLIHRVKSNWLFPKWYRLLEIYCGPVGKLMHSYYESIEMWNRTGWTLLLIQLKKLCINRHIFCVVWYSTLTIMSHVLNLSR